jgi:hypothetical protein
VQLWNVPVRGHFYALGVREARHNLAPPCVAFYRRLVVDLLDAQKSACNLMALTAPEGSRPAVAMHSYIVERKPIFDREA